MTQVVIDPCLMTTREGPFAEENFSSSSLRINDTLDFYIYNEYFGEICCLQSSFQRHRNQFHKSQPQFTGQLKKIKV